MSKTKYEAWATVKMNLQVNFLNDFVLICAFGAEGCYMSTSLTHSLTHSLTFLTLLACNSAAMTSQFSSTRSVQFPPREVVSQQMKDAGLGYFVEKIKVLDLIQDRMSLLNVTRAIEHALDDYDECLKKNNSEQNACMMRMVMEESKHQMYEILLQNDPEALQALK